MKIIEHETLPLPDGIVHIISNNALSGMTTRFDITPYDFLLCDPVTLEFQNDTVISIDKSVAIDDKGLPFSVYIMGNHNQSLIRFLKKNEKTFQEFARDHPLFRPDLGINDYEIGVIVEHYSAYLLGKVVRTNPDLDLALGIGG